MEMEEIGRWRQTVVPGLPDELFIRGGAPLTKEEIRCLTLSKLRLQEGNRVLDIGAGSGGLTVECARLLKEGLVWAVERDPRAVDLLQANCRRFGVENVTIIQGEAPAALEGLGPFHRVLIGGSGGKIEGIIKKVMELLLPGGVVVINCLLLESLSVGLRFLKKEGFSAIQLLQAALSRSAALGSGTALQPLNPVFIVSARKGED